MSWDNGQFKKMSYGADRRKAIMENIAWRINHADSPMTGLPVNNMWQMNIEKDQDLRYLIKKGKLKRVRSETRCSSFSWRGINGKRQTYLVPTGDAL